MTDITRTAVIGTDAANVDAKAFLRSVTVHGLQAKAGYVADVLTEDDGYLFDFRRKGDIRLIVNHGMVFGLPPSHWIEMILPTYRDGAVICDGNTKICYANVLVFDDSVIFHFTGAAEISFEWRQLEVTRDALIEIWESDKP